MNKSFVVGQRVRITNVYALPLSLDATTGTVIDMDPSLSLPVGVEMDDGGVVYCADSDLELLPGQEPG